MTRGDTDTKAAITGSIAEAFYEVPDTLYEQACSYLEPDMLDIVQQYYQQDDLQEECKRVNDKITTNE
jgi:ADP-ribosyl-[dinitrogen reductase] hydrolase